MITLPSCQEIDSVTQQMCLQSITKEEII